MVTNCGGTGTCSRVTYCGVSRLTISWLKLVDVQCEDFILKMLKSKRIPSIFNDESTGSFICLRRHINMSHVNKLQLIRVKMICVAVIRTFQLIVVQKMWILAVALTTYVSFCIV
jgi:hypothetical protein